MHRSERAMKLPQTIAALYLSASLVSCAPLHYSQREEQAPCLRKEAKQKLVYGCNQDYVQIQSVCQGYKTLDIIRYALCNRKADELKDICDRIEAEMMVCGVSLF